MIASIIDMARVLGLLVILLVFGYFITLTLALGSILVALLLLALVGLPPTSIVPVLSTPT
jgi:hypothetical protein